MPDYPCATCGGTAYVGPDTFPPDHPDRVFCVKCYIPKNPTRGWLFTNASKVPEFNVLKYRSMSDDAGRTYMLKLLKMKEYKKEDTKKSDINDR